jgi:predicted RNA-binding Zn ribbon-like protein
MVDAGARFWKQLARSSAAGYDSRVLRLEVIDLSRPLAASASRRSSESPGQQFVAERLWLDFVNTDSRGSREDALGTFERFVDWMVRAGVLDADRGPTMIRRAEQQPAGATAVLLEARRVRAILRHLAERGASTVRARMEALEEINRVLGRSAGTRRIEARSDGAFSRSFVPVGDAFAGLLIPVVDSAADALVSSELQRVRRCADPRCTRVFYDTTRNSRRRWCDMATCGNRAKAARHRLRSARA